MDLYALHDSPAQPSIAYGIGTIPVGYRPKRDYEIVSGAYCANAQGGRYSASIKIKTSGRIEFVGDGQFVEAGFSFAIPIL